jgi:hypothetical protein
MARFPWKRTSGVESKDVSGVSEAQELMLDVRKVAFAKEGSRPNSE